MKENMLYAQTLLELISRKIIVCLLKKCYKIVRENYYQKTLLQKSKDPLLGHLLMVHIKLTPTLII